MLGLGTGQSLTPIFQELIQRYERKEISFKNVIVFNAYEYFPLKADSPHSALEQLKTRFLNHVDILEQNVYSLDGTVAQDTVQEQCRLFEERIQTFGGIDIMLLGIGRIGNIATNEPGSVISSSARLILIDATSREEMTMSTGARSSLFYHVGSCQYPCLAQDLPDGVGRRESRYHQGNGRRPHERCHSGFFLAES